MRGSDFNFKKGGYMGEDIVKGLVSTLPLTGAAVTFFTHLRSHRLTQSTNKTNLRLRIFDFWQLHQDRAALDEAPNKQLRHLFYLYSGQTVEGRLVWAALRDHPDPEAIEQLVLAHKEVKVGEDPGFIRHKRPRWKLEGTEALLIIIYVLATLSWFLLIGPGVRWIYGDLDSLSLLDKLGSALAVLISSVLVIAYVSYCFRYIEKARAARRLTQTKRMNIWQALRLRCVDIWQQARAMPSWLRGLLP